MSSCGTILPISAPTMWSVANCGSSSGKACLYRLDTAYTPAQSGRYFQASRFHLFPSSKSAIRRCVVSVIRRSRVRLFGLPRGTHDAGASRRSYCGVGGARIAKDRVRAARHRILMKRLTKAQSELIDAFLAEHAPRVSTAQIEKDFFITEVFSSFDEPVVYEGNEAKFLLCGGTAVSKAHRLTDRVSEDVDLRVILPDGLSGAAQRRMLRHVKSEVIERLRKQVMTFPARP
jgi:hypothetical protein